MPSKTKTMSLTPDQMMMLKQAACSIQQVLGDTEKPKTEDDYEPAEEGDDDEEDDEDEEEEDEKPRNLTYEMSGSERDQVKADAKKAGMTHDKMGLLVKIVSTKK